MDTGRTYFRSRRRSISDRTYWTPVIPPLAERFTVITVDRRGRGDSGDAPTYAIGREFEDIAAVVHVMADPGRTRPLGQRRWCSMTSVPLFQ